MKSVLAILTCLAVCVSAQNYKIYTNKTFLSMKKTKDFFKIALFPDIHYANGSTTQCVDINPNLTIYPCSDLNTTAFMEALLEMESPDLVIFMGDNIQGGEITDHEAALKAVIAPVEKFKVPHMMIFGEKDDEITLTPGVKDLRRKLMQIAMKSPYSLSRMGPSEVYGVSNYAYRILGKTGKPTHNIYLMDSSSCDTTGVVGGYDWMRASQVHWYNRTSFLAAKALGKTLPGLLFHHIPLPQHELVWHCNKGTEAEPITFTGFGTTNLPDGYVSASGIGLFAGYDSCQPDKTVDGCFGWKLEGVNSSRIDSGLFAAIVERKEIKMLTASHDHLNHFCCPWGNNFTQVCYTGNLGYHGYANKAGHPRRSRIIRLYPHGTIDTYQRLEINSKPPYAVVDEQVIYRP